METAAPADAAALFDLGNSLLERGRAEAAIEAFRRCLLAAPDHPGANYNLGNCLLRVGRLVEAIEAYLGCVRKAPEFGAGYVNLADTLRRLGLLDQARWAAEHGLTLLPEMAEAETCLASVLHDSAQYERAAELYQRALERAPTAGTFTSLGNTLRAMGRVDQALEAHESAIATAPGDAEARFSRALTLLSAGDYGRGFADYEWRWLRSEGGARALGRWWKGEAPAGRTILLHAEQGLGDTLQFIRYAPLVAGLGARVVVEVQPELVRLVGAIPGVAEAVPHGQTLPPFDLHCPLMSLPRVFGTQLGTVPDRVPYLVADPEMMAAWRARLSQDGTMRVGLCWAGAAHADDVGARLIDQRRSIGLAGLRELSGIEGVRFISLQKASEGELSSPVTADWMEEVGDFADTAALVANLDLVISVDTAVAHLAGALGRPVWLLSRYDGCWRWLYGRDDSPWYPSMRIYRQEQPLDWNPVVGRIRRDLMVLAGSAAPADRLRGAAA
ncbi:MAG TPA: tetratricopeptide repeat-containing glycosyltransferase family protein [Acetobacteraceae bacterium]|nr:tetratricopeptide repeat-containing glycosyltransferase family protein [Acetobacteraceae bacterium]